MPRVAVILPAAGQSSRFSGKEKKVFANVDGRAVWLRSAEAFVNRSDVVQTILVVAPEDLDTLRSKFGAHLGLLGVEVVSGGKERFESVGNALAKLRDDVDLVAIHDAARPCITSKLIDDVFAAAAKTGAALLAVPISDTIKRSNASGQVEATVSRQGLWLAQTPQVFRRDWLVEAHAQRAKPRVARDGTSLNETRVARDGTSLNETKVARDGTSLSETRDQITDDAQLIEAAGHPVFLVTGSPSNVKITTRDDLPLAEAILKSRPAAKVPRSIHPFEDEAKW